MKEPNAIELALREDLQVLVQQHAKDILPLCAALDTALDTYVDQAVEGALGNRTDAQEPVYRALFALAARLILLRGGVQLEAAA